MRNVLLVMLGVLLLSCDDSINTDELKDVESKNSVQFKDGMLVFSSKDLLVKKIDKLKDEGIEVASEHMGDYYDKGFLSFRPLILADNVEMIERDLEARSKTEVLTNVFHSKNKTKSLNPLELQEKLENIVEDDEFASLLNKDGEVQIGDSLYKYTESGMYFVHIDDKDHLYEYLNANVLNNTHNASSKTKRLIEDDYEIIDERITRFAIEPQYGGGGGSSAIPNRVTSDLRDIVNSWDTTKGRETTIAGWFGDRRVTYAYISKHRRAKLIYTNQDWGLWEKTAIIVKYQKKGSGIWWRYKADELVLGINEVSFYTQINTGYVQQMPRTRWYYEKKVFDEHLMDITYKIDKYPDFPFKSPSVVVDLSAFGYNVNTTLTSKQITDLGYKLLKGEFIKLLKSLGQDSEKATEIQIVAFGGPRIYFSYFDITKREKNVRELHETFGFNFETPKLILNNRGGFSVSFDFPNLLDNETLKIDFYGGARRGTTWKGKRLIFD